MYEQQLATVLAAWNDGDLDGLDSACAANTTRRNHQATGGDTDDLAGLKEEIANFRTQFPDCHVEVTEFVEAGDQSFAEWTFTGTNTGPGDFPPTGKHVTVHGCSVNRYQDGKLAEEKVYFDGLGMMAQLGVIELPEG